MRKEFLILILTGGIMSCCCPYSKTFQEAEALLSSAPDSTLVMLDDVQAAGLRSRRLKAEYALLSARAQDAIYGFVPSEDAGRLAAAAEYFEKKGPREDRLDAWYLLGKVQLANNALYRAVVSFEHALAAADELKDDGARGRICHQLAYAFNASGQHVAAARQLYDSYQAFTRASMDKDSRQTLLEYGQAWYNFERYDEAAVIFNTVLAQAHEAKDTLAQVRCLQNYSAMLLEMDPVDPGLARDMLARVTDELHYPLGSADWGVLAYSAALLGQDAVFPEVLPLVHHVDLLPLPVQHQGHPGFQEVHPVRQGVHGADVLPVGTLDANQAGADIRQLPPVLLRIPQAEEGAEKVVVNEMGQGYASFTAADTGPPSAAG